MIVVRAVGLALALGLLPGIAQAQDASKRKVIETYRVAPGQHGGVSQDGRTSG